MKRDMDLIREILLKVEELPFDGAFHDITVEGRSDDEITYHVMLLHEAGLIEAADLSTLAGMCWKPLRLTYTGHEFLDAARSQTVWVKAKALVLKTSGALTVEALKIALPHVMRMVVEGRLT